MRPWPDSAERKQNAKTAWNAATRSVSTQEYSSSGNDGKVTKLKHTECTMMFRDFMNSWDLMTSPQLGSPHAQTAVQRSAINEIEPNRHHDSLIIKI